MNNVLFRAKREKPEYGMILIHGRGADAEDIMGLSEELNDDDFLYASPRAESNTWYPYSFLAPIEQNEPFLSNSLKTVHNLFLDIENKGISAEKIIIAGFSQGACLGLEYALRNPRKYGGIAAFSGATITKEANTKISLENTPVFLGCSERDPHIPRERVELSEILLKRLGADVLKKLYPGTFHGIIDDELKEMKKIVRNLKKK